MYLPLRWLGTSSTRMMTRAGFRSERKVTRLLDKLNAPKIVAAKSVKKPTAHVAITHGALDQMATLEDPSKTSWIRRYCPAAYVRTARRQDDDIVNRNTTI